MTTAPWKTCNDEWAQDLSRQQEEFAMQMERELVRRQVRQGIESMKENDELFLRVLLSVTIAELEPK